jgi:pimeloyl-ACP methyl ester carboxylesterase
LTNASVDLTFRIVAESTPGSAAGTSRIDNVSVASVTNKYLVTLEGQQIEVERWGSGPKGVVFFSHTGDLAGAFRDNAALVQSLVGETYSVFTWTYPPASPFNNVYRTLSDWQNGLVAPEDRLLFPGIASSLLAQLRQWTGLQQFVLVGNSLGAGMVLSDYDVLVQDPQCSMVLISPTEPFIPPTLPDYLENTLMVSDPYSLEEIFLRRNEDRLFCFRNTTLPLPAYSPYPGHIIINVAAGIEYAFSLLAYAAKPAGSFVTVSPKDAEGLWGNAVKRLDWFAAFGPEPVKLELLKSGQPVKTLAESIFNSGRFDWQIPADLPAGTDYSIRVSSLADPAKSGGDDLRFAIQTIPAATAVDFAKVAWETGSLTRFNDATSDVNVDGNPNVGNGILDIVKMEVVDTAEDIIFTMTVGGDVAAAGSAGRFHQ